MDPAVFEILLTYLDPDTTRSLKSISFELDAVIDEAEKSNVHWNIRMRNALDEMNLFDVEETNLEQILEELKDPSTELLRVLANSSTFSSRIGEIMEYILKINSITGIKTMLDQKSIREWLKTDEGKIFFDKAIDSNSNEMTEMIITHPKMDYSSEQLLDLAHKMIQRKFRSHRRCLNN